MRELDFLIPVPPCKQGDAKSGGPGAFRASQLDCAPHYKGLPDDTPLPAQGAPTYADHPAFIHDKYAADALNGFQLLITLHKRAGRKVGKYEKMMKGQLRIPEEYMAVIRDEADRLAQKGAKTAAV